MATDNPTAIPTPLMMAPDQIQRANEFSFSRRYVERYLKFELEKDTEVQDKIRETVSDIMAWMYEEYYESKQIRLSRLKALDVEQITALVNKLLIKCMFCQKPELFTGIVGQLASALGWDSKRQSIITISELLVHLARNKLIDIVRIESGGAGRKYKQTSIAVLACVKISDQLLGYMDRCKYLPPMVSEPKEVTRNDQSGYLTFNKAVTLNGRIDGHLSLDVLNTQNQTPFTLDLEFLLNVEEVPNKPIDTVDKVRAWEKFIYDSEQMYLLIHTQSQGNPECPGAIYFVHDFDLRGRMYVEGYHISYQGSPFKKAMIEFAEPEYTEVPEEFRTYTQREHTSCIN